MHSFSTIFTCLLAISASALAATTPTTFNATSNPVFTPNSGDIVPVGKPYKITWDPTESGTVSIILLRGPSTNILPLYPIVERLKNTGSYTWTPKSDLENDKTHYGLQIIIDSNGQYQYSTQFGISNPGYKPPVKSSSSYEPTTTSYATVSHTTKSYLTSLITVTTPTPYYNTTSYAPTYTSVPYPPSYNTTVAPPETKSTPAPTYSTNTPPAPSQTGAASSIKIASGLLIGVAGVAALLF